MTIYCLIITLFLVVALWITLVASCDFRYIRSGMVFFDLINFLASVIAIGLFCYGVIIYFAEILFKKTYEVHTPKRRVRFLKPFSPHGERFWGFLKKPMVSEKRRLMQGFAEFCIVSPSCAGLKKI